MAMTPPRAPAGRAAAGVALALALAALVALADAGRARAEPGGDTAAGHDVHDPIDRGDRNHVRVELGFAIAHDDDTDYFGMQPTLEGRFALGCQFGLQVVLPFMFVDVSAGGDGTNRFELANPSLAFEALLDDDRRAVKLARLGLTVPLVQQVDVDGLGDLEDALLQVFDVLLAWGGRGMFDMQRYAPETMSVFGQLEGVVDFDGLSLDLRGGLALLIPTGDDADLELLVQLLARLGYGREVRPFVGLGAAFIPTEAAGLGDDDEDVLQLGLQLGLAAALGRSRLDVYLQVNLDEPMGSSFSDEGVVGIHVAGTFPF